MALPMQVGRKRQAVCTTDCITVAGGENTTVDALYQRFGPEVQAGKQLFLESTIQSATSGMSTLSLTLPSQLVAPWFAGCAMACWLHRGALVAPWRVGYIVVCWLCHRMLVTAWRAGYAMACWLHRRMLVTPWIGGYIVGCWLRHGVLVTSWPVLFSSSHQQHVLFFITVTVLVTSWSVLCLFLTVCLKHLATLIRPHRPQDAPAQ